jgi:hypothetical protein
MPLTPFPPLDISRPSVGNQFVAIRNDSRHPTTTRGKGIPMRTLFHRLGAGALLAGAAMLSGCLNADKDKPKYPAIPKPVATNQQNVNLGNGNQPGAMNPPANSANTFGPSGTTNNATQPNQYRSNNSNGSPTDPNARINMNGGPLNNGNPNVGSNNPQPYNGSAQLTSNNGMPNLKPIGSNSMNPNQPVMANGGGQPGNVITMPAPDATPRNGPPPISAQAMDGDLNRPQQ